MNEQNRDRLLAELRKGCDWYEARPMDEEGFEGMITHFLVVIEGFRKQPDGLEVKGLTTGPYISRLDIELVKVEGIVRRQRQKYTEEHDKNHQSWEWLGLITQYAAAGRYADAAALCIAASLSEVKE